MNNTTDLLLINSFAPRQRIVSDAALENGLAIIRTHLENKGFNVNVFDDQRVTGVNHGIPVWYNRLLRLFVKIQISIYSAIKPLSILFFLIGWPLHSIALYCRKVYMQQLINNIVDNIINHNIPMVGIKVWNGDAYTWSVELAKKIKQACPDTTVIAGGPQVKVYGDRLLDINSFDFVIMGPGEEILETLLTMRKTSQSHTEFVKTAHNKLSKSRLILTGNYSVDNSYKSDNLTIPKYTSSDLKDKILFHTLIDGMGCSWNKCNFCSHTRQIMQYAPRPVNEIKDEIKAVTSQGISFFRFSSSETPLFHGKNIAEMLLYNKININYSMFVRAGKVSKETYETYCLMIRAGLRAVFMGGETGHDLINSLVMNKGVTKKNIIDTIHCIKLASETVGIPCKIGLSLIYPTPLIDNITHQDVFDENLSLIEEALPDTVIINPPGVFPGTNWFDEAEKFGFKISEDFVKALMSYEYSMYKPVQAWKKLDYSLAGDDIFSLLNATGKLHKAVEAMHIPLGISDEYLMMLTAIGHGSTIDLLEFKQRSLIDIMSGSSEYLEVIVKKINDHSMRIAYSNHN
jgi:radical SAM superfamily enzyme YgiQ (UPF0313 family)